MLILIALVVAIFEWVGEYRENRIMIYFTKPTVIVFLLAWVLSSIDLFKIFRTPGGERMIWFVIGFVFCLAGDIFLMLPERFFLTGLISFLGGHVLFILGFGRLVPKGGDIIPGLILFIMVAIVTIGVYKKIAQGLVVKNITSMKVPVVLYSIIISIMLYSALITLLDNNWKFLDAFVVSSGALMFYFSDVLNAWLRFVGKLPAGRVKAMITYHLAQISLAAGVVLHFTSLVDGNL